MFLNLATKGGEDYPTQPKEPGSSELVPYVCSRPGRAYTLRLKNRTREHVACTITVDGRNAILEDGDLIVAPKDKCARLFFFFTIHTARRSVTQSDPSSPANLVITFTRTTYRVPNTIDTTYT